MQAVFCSNAGVPRQPNGPLDPDSAGLGRDVYRLLPAVAMAVAGLAIVVTLGQAVLAMVHPSAGSAPPPAGGGPPATPINSRSPASDNVTPTATTPGSAVSELIVAST